MRAACTASTACGDAHSKQPHRAQHERALICGPARLAAGKPKRKRLCGGHTSIASRWLPVAPTKFEWRPVAPSRLQRSAHWSSAGEKGKRRGQKAGGAARWPTFASGPIVLPQSVCQSLRVASSPREAPSTGSDCQIAPKAAHFQATAVSRRQRAIISLSLSLDQAPVGVRNFWREASLATFKRRRASERVKESSGGKCVPKRAGTIE